jgi:hypothetical protein
VPVPIKGDRSAFDDIGYPEVHSRDLELGTPIHHLPDDAAEGEMPVWRTDHWDAALPMISENLTAQVDGENVTFVLSQPFTAGSTRVFINGLVQTGQGCYTENPGDGEIVFTDPPSDTGFTDEILVDYKPL